MFTSPPLPVGAFSKTGLGIFNIPRSVSHACVYVILKAKTEFLLEQLWWCGCITRLAKVNWTRQWRASVAALPAGAAVATDSRELAVLF